MPTGDAQREQRGQLNRELEKFVKASILRAIFHNNLERCHGREARKEDLILSDTALAYYHLNNGNNLEKIVETMKMEISANLDEILRNSRTDRNVVEDTYTAVDTILHDFPGIGRNGSKLRVAGRFCSYDIDLFDGTVVAKCRGNHRTHQNLCFRMKGDIDSSLGLDRIPLGEPRIAVSLAVNLVREEMSIGNTRSFRYLGECPYCIVEGLISKEDVDILEAKLQDKGLESGRFWRGEFMPFQNREHVGFAEIPNMLHADQILDEVASRLYNEWQEPR